MAKKQSMTYESALEDLKQVKEDLREARGEMSAFLKENKLKRNEDHSNHETRKIAAGFKRKKKAITDLETKKETLTQFCKDNKPKKERVTMYNYPEGIDNKEKKAIRTKARAAAKKLDIEVSDYLANQAKYDKQLESSKPAKKEKPATKKTTAAKKGTTSKKTTSSKKRVPRVSKKKATAEAED